MTFTTAFALKQCVPTEASRLALSDLAAPIPANPRCAAARVVPGSSWGTFTIACTIPIALFVGLYMYKIRPGQVVEASIIGGVLTLAATVARRMGRATRRSASSSISCRSQRHLGDGDLRLHRGGAAGVGAALPARLSEQLSEDRHDRAARHRHAHRQSEAGSAGVQPRLPTAGRPCQRATIFPFLFITIMCGAISGFHALVSSGTTPKMIRTREPMRARSATARC